MYGYIYKIENLLNGKIYIGQTTQTLIQRNYKHFYELERNNHSNFHLQRAFNKYGRESFKFQVLNYATSKEFLDEIEVGYIQKYDCLNRKKGYNIRNGGANGKPSELTCKKMSEVHKGKKHSKETKKKISQNHSKIWLGKKHSKESCKRMSEAKRGVKHPLYGKKHSNDTRRKIGEACQGKYPGVRLNKRANPEKKCWYLQINFNGNIKSLGCFQEPISASIVYKLVSDEIHN